MLAAGIASEEVGETRGGRRGARVEDALEGRADWSVGGREGTGDAEVSFGGRRAIALKCDSRGNGLVGLEGLLVVTGMDGGDGEG